MAKAISQQGLLHLTNAFATVKEAVLKSGRQVTEGEQYWLRHCSDILRIAKHQCEYMPILFGATHTPNQFRRLTELLVLLVSSLQPDDVIPGEICFRVCATREEALQRTQEHQRQLDGNQRVKTRGEPVRHHRAEWHEHYRTEQCATVTESPMSDHDSGSAKMDSDDESTLHIHDCDVKNDAEEASTIYVGEIHTRLAEKQDHVAIKHQQPDRYVKHNNDLEWADDNTVPDVLAMTELESMDVKIWIPIFTGKNFKGFIEKFEDLREVLGWDEMTSRVYLIRSLRLPDSEAPQHIARWKYDAIVIYLTEQYTSLCERLDAITQVIQIQRQLRESLNDLTIRISRELTKVPLNRKRKAALASAAF